MGMEAGGGEVPVRSVGVRELKNQASRIVHAVQEQRAEYVITLRGEPVAVLRPFGDQDAQRLQQAEVDQALAEMKRLAEQVAEAWTSPKNGVELVQEQRAEYVITLRGEPVAVLRPFGDQDAQRLQQAEVDQALAEMKWLAQQVAEAWTSPKSGVELVQEQRR